VKEPKEYSEAVIRRTKHHEGKIDIKPLIY